MKVAIIGAGRLASILGRAWAKAGHTVTFGVRSPGDSKVTALLFELGANARAASVEEAVKDAEVIALAVPWSSFENAIHQAGNLTGKVLIDCSSPFKDQEPGKPNSGVQLGIGFSTSGAETVAKWAPTAQVVLAFNAPGIEVLADPVFNGQRATQYICGDEPDAKRKVSQLAQDLGFDVCDAGSLVMARLLEPMAMVWIDMSRNQKRGVDFAFKLVTRGAGLAPPS